MPGNGNNLYGENGSVVSILSDIGSFANFLFCIFNVKRNDGCRGRVREGGGQGRERGKGQGSRKDGKSKCVSMNVSMSECECVRLSV